MRTTFLIAVAMAVAGCSSEQDASAPSRNDVNPPANDNPPVADNSSTTGADNSASPRPDDTSAAVADSSSAEPASEPSTADPEPGEADSPTIKPLTPEQQQQLLAARLEGGMDYSFGQFANMFLVTSRIRFGTGIGLMTSDQEIFERPLQSPFPASYKPTLREFLDAIALQTFSEWKYDPTSKFFQSDVEIANPVDGIAIFEFKQTKREKPYTITLAEGWKAEDMGNWVMYVPPDFPVGMDIYEMGAYSPQDKAGGAELADRIRSAMALEWAQRVDEHAASADLKPAKVGKFDALYFEAMVPSQFDKDVKWRHWVFMVDNKCYFIVSTILPELEEKIFPDVRKMIESFQVRAE